MTCRRVGQPLKQTRFKARGGPSVLLPEMSPLAEFADSGCITAYSDLTQFAGAPPPRHVFVLALRMGHLEPPQSLVILSRSWPSLGQTESKDPRLFLPLLLRCRLTTTRGCPILSAPLSLRLGWDTSNPPQSLVSLSGVWPLLGQTESKDPRLFLHLPLQRKRTTTRGVPHARRVFDFAPGVGFAYERLQRVGWR